MKKDKTRAPAVATKNKQLASLRTRQERHEQLAEKHTASAKRLWLRRVLLELGHEQPKGKPRARPKARRRTHASK
jgi:hypothetical protein